MVSDGITIGFIPATRTGLHGTGTGATRSRQGTLPSPAGCRFPSPAQTVQTVCALGLVQRGLFANPHAGGRVLPPVAGEAGHAGV